MISSSVYHVKQVRWGQLKKLASSQNSDLALAATEEIERRGLEDNLIDGKVIQISYHAIDRFSTRKMHLFLNDNPDGQGLYSWLVSKLKLASKEFKLGEGNYTHDGITFVFRLNEQNNQLVVVTIY